ncbi:ribonucleotide-diphosphate reductase subunit beta [Ralstonia phage RSP15]|uniref:ribonucleotide-diphosphate reductase subunit beta n=1 Tax=Ralstonia phage RSP15 TaxID=1785960 RepID=UPI00074D38A0|nr:ribonucleotide-diphosphate reductase subunit beta [Ralstonia phage RSP15]BAU40019.1 ribonucleotide-diphosphate reductase subunit beta [Ralstonia phage RSP15]
MNQDAIQAREATETVLHIYTSNLLRQTTLDSGQGKLPSQIFAPICSLPEFEELFLNWGYFEGTIHNRAYAHIVKNTFTNSGEQFDKIHETQEIVQMSANIGKYYDRVHYFNCLRETLATHPELKDSIPYNEYEHKKAIYLAMHASYALEAIRFIGSFATSLAMAENKLFVGNGNVISLIMKDELLHKAWTAYILNIMLKDDPVYKQIFHDCKEEIYEIYRETVEEEKNWSKYLFQKGVILGMNEQILNSEIDHIAGTSLAEVGIKYREKFEKEPVLKWMLKYKDSTKRQGALQETENVSYVVGSTRGALNVADLPEVDF